MPDKKKQPAKSPEESGEEPQKGTGLAPERWRKWKVKPDCVPVISSTVPPESGIGARIAYCRGQLDNLSADALSRYTKYFDQVGISRQSIVRYEANDTLPGSRELRILCDTLWVPPQWLIYGTLTPDEYDPAARTFLAAFSRYARIVTGQALPKAIEDANELAEQGNFEQRQRWIDEARHPPDG